MDKRLELAEALMDLSRTSERVARLLTTAPIEFTTEKVNEALATAGVSVNPWDYHDWPHMEKIDRAVPGADEFVGLSVLEWASGAPVPVTAAWTHARQIDIISETYAFTGQQPPNIRIVNTSSALDKQYDVGIIWETLEFLDDPLPILLMFKSRCRVIYVRFRPWTSRDGAFLSNDRPFYHLAVEAPTAVRWRVVRPLATYDQLTQVITVRERRVNTTQLAPFFKNNQAVMDIIKARTWGEISTDQAIKILMTDSVDYVLG